MKRHLAQQGIEHYYYNTRTERFEVWRFGRLIMDSGIVAARSSACAAVRNTAAWLCAIRFPHTFATH